MASDTRISPAGILFFVLALLAILFAVFIFSQRGGEVDGAPGTTEVDPPTQLETEEALGTEGAEIEYE